MVVAWPSLTQSLTDSLARSSLARSLTHSLTHSLARSLARSLAPHSLAHSLTHSITRSLAHSLTPNPWRLIYTPPYPWWLCQTPRYMNHRHASVRRGMPASSPVDQLPGGGGSSPIFGKGWGEGSFWDPHTISVHVRRVCPSPPILLLPGLRLPSPPSSSLPTLTGGSCSLVGLSYPPHRSSFISLLLIAGFGSQRSDCQSPVPAHVCGAVLAIRLLRSRVDGRPSGLLIDARAWLHHRSDHRRVPHQSPANADPTPPHRRPHQAHLVTYRPSAIPAYHHLGCAARGSPTFRQPPPPYQHRPTSSDCSDWQEAFVARFRLQRTPRRNCKPQLAG